MPETRSFMRLLVALVLTAHASLPVAAAVADAPPVPAVHDDHVSAEGAAGCQLFHDEFDCMLCRVLSAHPVAGQGAAGASGEGPETVVEAASAGTLPVQSATPSTRHARAPPVS